MEEENDNEPKSETKTRYHHFYQETLSCSRVVTNSTIRSWSGTMSGNDSSGLEKNSARSYWTALVILAVRQTVNESGKVVFINFQIIL